MKKNIDFFIIGAPKSGTSALYDYLQKHPEIFVPEHKIEPHYFSKDIALSSRHRDDESYYSLFSEAQVSQKIGEASTWYLYSEQAIDAILEAHPNTKIIVMLRNPVDMAYSMHSFNYVKMIEDEPDFEKAWRLQNARKQGKNLPRYVVDPKFVSYRDTCALADAVKRVQEKVPRENLLIHIYEEFFRNPEEGYQKTLQFLGVTGIPLGDAPKVNENRVWRNRLVASLVQHPPAFMKALSLPLKKLFNSLGLYPGRALYKLNKKSTERRPLKPELRAELEHEFEENNRKISSLLCRDTPLWPKSDPIEKTVS